MPKVNCSICGEEMPCQESMLKAEKHICSFCTDIMKEGMSDDEIKEMSLEERRFSEFYPDVRFLSELIFDVTFPVTKLSERELRNLSKRQVMEEFYSRGILSAIDFMLHFDSNVIRQARLDVESETITPEELSKRLEEDGINLDMEKFENYDGNLSTEEGIARFLNEVMFEGDWEKHLKWIEKKGSEAQKRESTPLIKRLREEDEKAE